MRQLVDSPAFQAGLPSQRLLGDLQATVDLNASLARLTSDAMGTRTAFATRPAVTYQNYLQDLVLRPSVHGAEFASASGIGLTGLVATDLLTSYSDVESDEPEADQIDVAEQVEVEVLEPWKQASHDAHEHLYRVLGEKVHPQVAELLQGGWNTVAQQGPAAVSIVANCGVEALDRALRIAAPNEAVFAWIESANLDRKGLIANDRPTRTARVRFLMRNRGGDRKVVEAQVNALAAATNATHARLEGAKHASEVTVLEVQCYLMSAESILSALFVVTD